MNDPLHYIKGDTAVKIAECIENAVRAEKLPSGQKLPPVRTLAGSLGVSPATVAAAYQALQSRGVVISQGRRGTKVSYRPMSRRCGPTVIARDARNLFDGNPDPCLLPAMGPALKKIDTAPRLYCAAPQHPELTRLIAQDFKDEGVARGEIAFVNGAMDGIERVLIECLRPGDRVVVEDPSFANILDLVISRGLSLVPVRIDEAGLLPDELQRACGERAKALILAPRAQNPTGAATTAERASALRAVLRQYPDVVVIEDDHAGLISTTPFHALHRCHPRWVYIRSFSKALNPDLRLAAITGDVETMTRVQDRMVLGERWVSHILQRIAWKLLSDSSVRKQLRHAAKTYAERRQALTDALAAAGFAAMGTSGYNVWLPVAEECTTVHALLQAGWAVSAGERFRINSPPAIRITAATLKPAESKRFAADLTAVMTQSNSTSLA